MHSKNLSADSSGFQQLSESDIKEVEKGTADIREKSLFVGKLNELRFQIHEANNPNGSTIRQRIEYWKTGIEIIKENVFIGVGTGDVKDEFQKKYIENKSSLLPENRLETHNTYLTFFITFGLFGIGYLIYFLFKTYFFLLKHRDVLGVIFIILISASFLTEDTLETQMGITIFSFLFSLFSIKKPKENSSGSCLVE
jgi:O-antigen ligase